MLSRARNPWDNNPGKPDTMPAKMMSEMPLPTPRSVMSSPIQTSSIVPPTKLMTMVSVSKEPSPKKPMGWVNTPAREKRSSWP